MWSSHERSDLVFHCLIQRLEFSIEMYTSWTNTEQQKSEWQAGGLHDALRQFLFSDTCFSLYDFSWKQTSMLRLNPTQINRSHSRSGGVNVSWKCKGPYCTPVNLPYWGIRTRWVIRGSASTVSELYLAVKTTVSTCIVKPVRPYYWPR